MKTKVLMVCLGNICRSPLAEGLLKAKVNNDKVFVDSAGTSNYHVGNTPDPRSIAIAKRHGIDIAYQTARQFTREDFDKFDYIYVMDKSNYRNVINLARNEQDKSKVSLILNTILSDENSSVPDPYQGGDQGFENVYYMLDEATNTISKELNKV
ncbi:low molecular weight protein-tyrosine-phosphatase [Mesonia aestuariivivens]|uniref:protein-tyrosine-phosphatase n=1 Tax=Mesonia aestuariivivens TaxID=2796128 RepID=A0ABS6W042_9FLAO|nr:low molecular weight protein-tyrosine-phosphatase [Mesonia aestuariivivens]MBW2961209.1 low molecular weight phosphotyrosine protein phosphatase [Mesonia aestuariivivens]